MAPLKSAPPRFAPAEVEAQRPEVLLGDVPTKRNAVSSAFTEPPTGAADAAQKSKRAASSR
jgi:hypothetical protein